MRLALFVVLAPSPPIAHNMRMRAFISLMLFLCAAPLPVQAGDPTNAIFHHSGLPVPRFVSLKSSEVNWRVGPGTRYPIEWVYHRANWPVEIIEEFGHWREIRDIEGTTGWVHKGLLSGTRYAIITGEQRPLYLAPDARSVVVMEARANVSGQLLRCSEQWCQLDINDKRGWIRRDHLWGIYPKEKLDDD